MKRKMRVYFANGLFSEADRDYNEKVAQQIEALGIEVYLPQRNASINDKTKAASATMVYDGDTDELKKADVLVAVIDGPVIDAGVAAEIGWCAGWNEICDSKFMEDIRETLKGNARHVGDDPSKVNVPIIKPMIGLYTDCREMSRTINDAKVKMSSSELGENQFPYANIYVTGALKKYGKIVSSTNDLLDSLNQLLKVFNERG